jgi:hypothetical protein
VGNAGTKGGIDDGGASGSGGEDTLVIGGSELPGSDTPDGGVRGGDDGMARPDSSP